MGYGFKHGGGGGSASSVLNFRVVGGTAQPAAPKENDIWVHTDTEITSWVLSPEEPEGPVEGMVWISVGSASVAGFNALKKNSIMVYPIGAKQYISGVWANKVADDYQNGAWANFGTEAIYLYLSGDTCDSMTGGYTTKALKSSATATGGTLAPSVTYGESSMVISAGKAPSIGTYRDGIVHTVSKIDCSGYSKLIFEGTVSGLGYQYTRADISLWSEIGSNQAENRVAKVDLSNGTDPAVLDISSLTGSYHIGFGFTSSNAQITVNMTAMRLE